MTEREFNDLRLYMDRQWIAFPPPSASLIRAGYLREIVRGVWEITPKGRAAFEAITTGKAGLRP